MKPTLVVEIDWNDDDDFGDSGEDVTSHLRFLRTFQGRKGPLGMAPPAICEIELQNREARYSPENASSPLNSSPFAVLPRRRLRVRTTAPVGRTIFDGRIDDISIEQLHNSSRAHIVALDETAFLLRERGWIYSPQTGLIPLEPDAGGVGPLTGVAVTAILDEVGWDAGDRVIGAGITEMDTYWARDPLDAFGAISALVNEELGYAYVEAGVFTFQGRDHRYTGARLTSQGTYSDAAGAARRYSRMEPYRMGIERVANFARAKARPRTASASEQVWTLGIPEDSSGAANPTALAPGESRSFFPTWDNPASGTYAVTFVANSAADGTGTDLTASVTKTESEPKANRYKVKLGNDTDPAQTVYITSMFLTVNIRLPQDEATEGEAQDPTSQTAYGVRHFPVEPQFIGKPNNADDWAGYAIAVFKNPIPVLELSFKPYDSTILTEMLTRALSDRVTIVSGEIGINDDYFIEGIGYEWHPDREAWLTTMVLSKVATGNQFMLLDDDPLAKLGDAGIGAVFG